MRGRARTGGVSGGGAPSACGLCTCQGAQGEELRQLRRLVARLDRAAGGPPNPAGGVLASTNGAIGAVAALEAHVRQCEAAAAGGGGSGSAAAAAAAGGGSDSAAGAAAGGLGGRPVSPATGLPSGMAGVRQLLRATRLDSYAEAFELAGFDDADFLLEVGPHRTVDQTIQDVCKHVPLKPGHAAKLRDHLWAHAAQIRAAAAGASAQPLDAIQARDQDMNQEPEVVD